MKVRDNKIRKLLKFVYLKVFFFNRKVTVSDGLLRCLKKGSGEEQALSAKCLSLLCIQLGNEIEEDFKDVHSLLLTIISDTTAPVKARTEVCLCVIRSKYLQSIELE